MRHLKMIHSFVTRIVFKYAAGIKPRAGYSRLSAPTARLPHCGAITPALSGLFLFCFFLAGCNLFSATPPLVPTQSTAASQPAVNGTIDYPIASHGCGQHSPVTPGSSVDQTFAVNPADSHGYHTRSYRVHVPVGYQNSAPTALILYFHGFGGSAAGGDRSSGFSTLADQHGFIVAYGQGLPEGEDGVPFWASAGPIDYGIDDVHYVSLMLDNLQNTFCIDAHRIFVTGFSNGGGMVGYLTCRLAGRIAAAAPVSGNYYALPGGCHPDRPLPILAIHGSADPILPYQGISPDLNAPWPLPSIPQWLHNWATRNGCHQGPAIFLNTAQVMGEQWTECKGNAAVVHYLIKGGGHSWPSMLGSLTSLETLWDFFQAHPLSEQA